MSVRHGPLRPDYGPGWSDARCEACGASWVGLTGNGDWCPWCETSLERLITDTRMDLLHPAWLDVDHGPRYDELSDDDKLVWDAYRGNATGGGSRATWAARLGRAVKAGLITEAEAMGALRRSGVGDNPAA